LENGIKILVVTEAGRTYECNIEEFFFFICTKEKNRYKKELLMEWLQLQIQLAYGIERMVEHSEAILL
jgi:CRISPR/Cas system CSM-associated protein Csm2 small subunit